MRTINFWKSFLMSAALLVSGAMVSCEKDDDGHPSDLDPKLSATASAEIVQLGETFTIDVVCATDWRLEITDNALLIDYISAYDDTGNETIKIKIVDDPKDAEDLDDSYVYVPGDAIKFVFEADGYINGLQYTDKKTVTVKVGTGEGDVWHEGTADVPFSVANAVEIATAAGQDEANAEGPFYIKGIVTEVSLHFADPSTTSSGSTVYYGNATFKMVDKGTTSPVFTAYQVYYLDGKQYTAGEDVKEGDEVVVCGKIYNYKGNTPETLGKGAAYLYSLNGVTAGEGGSNTPGDEAVDVTPGEYYMFGKLETDNDGKSLAPYIYHAWDGTLTTSSSSTYLTTVSYSSSDEKTFTAQSSNTAAKVQIEAVSGKEGTYYIKYNNQYLYNTTPDVNHSLALGEDASVAEWTFTAHDNGGVVAINNTDWLGTGSATKNYLRSYKESSNSSIKYGILFRLVSETTLNDNSGSTEPDPTPDYTHKGTAEDPFTVADAIAKAKETGTTATTDLYYIKGKISAIKYTFSAQYGTATFDMVDEGSSDIFTAYAIKYFNNVGWVDGNTQVQVGDEVTVCGKIINYSGNTPETAQGSGYLVELNGDKGSDNGDSGNGGGTEPEEPTPGEDKSPAVIDLTATGVSGSTYVTSAQTFTLGGISYTAHNFNPKSGQVKGNQTAAASNFYINNNTAYSGKIKTITMTTGATDTAKFQNNCYCQTGSAAISTPAGEGTAGTISGDGKTITWELNSDNSYFMISSKEKYTSGSATAVTITVTYEQ